VGFLSNNENPVPPIVGFASELDGPVAGLLNNPVLGAYLFAPKRVPLVNDNGDDG
jgi:hypothetical protein